MGPISSVMEPVNTEAITAKTSTESRLEALETRLRILEAQLAASTSTLPRDKGKRKLTPRPANGSADEHVEVTQALVRHEDLWGSFRALTGLSREMGQGWRGVEEVVSEGAMRGAYLSYVRSELL